MKKILFSLVVSVGFAFGAFANSWTYTITSGSATAGSSGTLTDGVWTFNASVDKNTTKMTVKEPVDAECPTEITLLDFSGKIVDSADDTIEYTIIKLDTKFSNHTAIREFVGRLTLPGEGLKSVGAGAFDTCRSMCGDLRFPSTLTGLGDRAFFDTGITSIYIAPTIDKCTIAGDYKRDGALSGNDYLTNIVFAAGGHISLEIGHSIAGCASLRDADLSGITDFNMYSGRETENDYAHFTWCSALTNVTLGANITNFVPNALFGNSGTALKTVRFTGHPPVNFTPPYLYGISISQSVKTIVPLEYADEWRAYAADGELNTFDSTWASEYVKSGTDLKNRLLVLDRNDGKVVPTITQVARLAYADSANHVTISVEGAELLGGSVRVDIMKDGAAVSTLDGQPDFGIYSLSGLLPGTEYLARVIATNVNGAVTNTSLTFTTFEIADEVSPTLFYDPVSKGIGLHCDNVQRTNLAGVVIYPISGESTWSEDSKIKTATKVYIDSDFVNYHPTSCASWFKDLASVRSVEGLEYLDVSECASLARLFMGTAVTTLDLSGFKTPRVTSIREMFRGCSNLIRVYANENFSTLSVVDDYYVFLSNNDLVGGNGTAYSGDHVNKEYARVDDPDGGKPGYFTYKAPAASKPVITTVSVFAVSNTTATVKVWGSDLQGGTLTIELYDGLTLVASRVSDDFGAFKFDDLARGATNSVKVTATNVNGTTIDESLEFHTWGKTTLAARAVCTWFNDTLVFFYDDVDRSSGATVYEFNANHTKTWGGSLNSVKDVIFDPSFKSFRPKTCFEWFSGARGKDEGGIRILGMENLDTRDVTSMEKMFYHTKFTSAPDMTHFNTRKVTSFASFTTYGGWAVMDCSSFDTRSVTDARGMFNGCKTIYASERFVTTKMAYSAGMFSSSSIIGGAGTVYDSNHRDKEYARIDGGPDSDTPGYFTYKRYPAPGLKIILR